MSTLNKPSREYHYQLLGSHVAMICLHILNLIFLCLFVFLKDEESIPVELRNLPEYKELLELKRLKKQKLQEIQEDKVIMRHVGYKVRSSHFCTS